MPKKFSYTCGISSKLNVKNKFKDRELAIKHPFEVWDQSECAHLGVYSI